MNIILSIISSLVLVYVRIWIINTIFSEKKIKIGLTLKIFGIGGLLVGALFAYKYALTYMGQANLYFLDNTNTQTLFLFIAYCTAFVLLVTFLLKGRYKKILQMILIGAIFFVAIGYGGYVLGINFLLLFYLISAYSEEYLKYSSGNSLWAREGSTNIRNLVFFCILVGLGFSVVENIFYIIYNLINHNQVNVIGLALGRGLISTLLHIVSTAFIAFITISISRKKSRIMALIVGIIGGRGLHSAYNLSLQYNLQYISIPVVVLSFFLLTFLLYQSDILYERSE